MKKLVSVLLLLLSTTAVAAVDVLMLQAQSRFKPIPDGPPALTDNPITAAKVELGKMLYFEPRLSASWLISCNTCHNVGLGGVDIVETSIGHGWQKGPRNAPTVFNAVFNIAQFWDGRAADLKAQAKGPVQAGVEMNNTPDRVVKTLNSIPRYVELFKAAFPAEKQPVTFDNMARAIEVFEATLVTPAARFDNYLRGDKRALSTRERRGLRLYIAKGCANCHSGTNMGGTAYYPFGVVKKPGAELLPPNDKGRFAVTRSASDEYVFRAPPLRNIVLTPPYFHTGRVWDVKQAVSIMGSSQLGINLTAEEAETIVAFLKTLTGEQPQVEYPVLPASTATTPLPITEVIGLVTKGH
jgi:cytochrome c peroxidase